MTSAIRARREAEDGFTLIELLVVVIIIGILAAIAIPAFLNQRENAYTSAVESDTRNAAIEVESFFVETDDYPTDNADFQANVPFQTSANVLLEFTNDGDGTYTIEGCHFLLDSGNTDCATFETHVTYDSGAGGIQ